MLLSLYGASVPKLLKYCCIAWGDRILAYGGCESHEVFLRNLVLVTACRFPVTGLRIVKVESR